MIPSPPVRHVLWSGTINIILDEPKTACVTLMLAHGAGAPMNSPWMNSMAAALAQEQFRVVRFEFEYMAARRQGREATHANLDDLIDEYITAVRTQEAHAPVLVGGKSMGGAIASMLADRLHAIDQIGGVVCFGFPFHGRDNPTDYRAAHLEAIQVPTLIVQGTADPFGNSDEIARYQLSRSVALHWLDGADHDLAKPEYRPTNNSNFAQAAAATAQWWRGLAPRAGA